jgi:osmotically-inducible protein OsmY
MNRLLTSTIVLSLLAATPACAPVSVATTAGSAAYAVADERSMGAIMDDGVIRTQILHKFFQQDMNDMFANVDVEVIESRVLLAGEVDHEETMVQAVRLTWDIAGVREVINEIRVADSHYTFAQRSSDTWITTQVKSKLLAEKYVRSVNYSIETVAGTVYLMGIAQNEEELKRVSNVVSRIRGVKRVVSYVRLKESVYRKGLESNL